MASNLQLKNNVSLISFAKKWGDIVLYVSILLEIVIYPSVANMFGCIACLFTWLIFKTSFLDKKILLKHPFSYIAFLSIFLSRFLALPATLLEGKPVSYLMEVPEQTFILDTIMFMVIALAFNFSTRKINFRKNNQIQKTLHKLNFFNTTPFALWFFGFIGTLARIQNIAVSGQDEFGDTGTRFLAGFTYLQYAPIIMLFPSLCNIKVDKKRYKFIVIYIGIMMLLSLAGNSRGQMIYPVFTIILLYVIDIVKENKSIFRLFSPFKLIVIVVFSVYALNFFSDISLSMLHNRRVRSDVDKTELFSLTVQTLQDESLMNDLRNTKEKKTTILIDYDQGWSENYLDNFMLNRYCNMRIVDQTLYYANKIGYSNENLKKAFDNKFLSIFPSPILRFFNINIKKEDFLYSPGDMLYSTATGNIGALGGFRVTSMVADVLATFGYWGFLIAFVLLYLSFKLMDCLVYYKKNGFEYATLGLINIFGFLGIFRYSVGIKTPLTYVLRAFWQDCFIFFILLVFVNVITLVFLPKDHKINN